MKRILRPKKRHPVAKGFATSLIDRVSSSTRSTPICKRSDVGATEARKILANTSTEDEDRVHGPVRSNRVAEHAPSFLSSPDTMSGGVYGGGT